MIALRGKLERIKKEPAEGSEPPAAAPAEESTKKVEEELEWVWRGHWAFGATLPEDEKKWQRFIYKWEAPVPPSEVVVISLNNAVAETEETEEEEEDKQEINEAKGETDNNQSETAKNKDDDAKDEQGNDASKAKEGTEEKAEDPTTKEETKEAVEKENNATEDAKEKSNEKTSNKTPAEQQGDKSKPEDQPTTSPNPPKKDKTENKPEETEKDESGKAVKSDTSGDKKEENKTEKSSTEESSKTTSSKRQKITFATPLSPDDPPFTDAAEKYPDKCPVGGRWKGHFENAVKTTKRKNSTAPPTTIQKIEETFHIYLNATPRKQAQTWFATDEIAANSRKKKPETPKDEMLGVLKDGLVHVRGTGENQFGNFELLGSFDVETGMLECQRMYVYEAAPSPVRRRSSNRGGSDSSKLNSEGRPYYTRKKQMSWKRRTSFGAGGSDSDGESGAGRKRGSVATSAATAAAAGGSGGKRVRVAEPKAAAPETSLPGPLPKAGGTAGLSIAVPPPTIGAKRPGASPKVGTPRAKKANTGSGNNTPASAKGDKGSTPASSTSSMYMKLPAVGDPKMAVWRAAHYLYYQKNDPNQEEGGVGGGTNSGSSNAAGNAYKYVVYEGEMSKSQREGRGVCLYSNQMLYEGEWKRNKEHGQGTLMTADRKRVIYEGEWERGRMHGKGTFYYCSGVVLNAKQQVVISDEVKGRKKTSSSSSGGPGTEAVESRYEGDFKENLRHGYGKYVLPDGSSYEGMWRENMMCGRGVFNWADGSFYDGEWKDGRRHGAGFLRVSDGFSYDGMWVQNAMEGRGTATYPNGQTYNGLFSNGRREGRGTIHFTNGAIYEGRFRNDAIDGQGTMKISQLITVPREAKAEAAKDLELAQNKLSTDNQESNEAKTDVVKEEEAKPDFMIPLSFQSDMGHIHQKAGFTVVGE